MNLSTPALLFPAVSLLFISYTNRFVSYANLVRRLHEQWRADGDPGVARQIHNLRRRISLIRNMQVTGATALIFSVVSMVALAFGPLEAGWPVWVADISFGVALVLMLVSLVLLIVEVSISMKALDVQLADLESGRRDVSSD